MRPSISHVLSKPNSEGPACSPRHLASTQAVLIMSWRLLLLLLPLRIVSSSRVYKQWIEDSKTPRSPQGLTRSKASRWGARQSQRRENPGNRYDSWDTRGPKGPRRGTRVETGEKTAKLGICAAVHTQNKRFASGRERTEWERPRLIRGLD